MPVLFQSTSPWRRLPRLVARAIMLGLAFGLTGVYVNLPPLGPPGINPEEANQWKKCPRCGDPVWPEPDGICICDSCSKKFKAANAKDYP